MLIFLFITLSVIIAYWPATQGEYIRWDDGVHFINNPLVFMPLPDSLTDIFTQFVNNTYIPLTTLSFSIEYHIAGLNPAVSHSINILGHIIICLLVYKLLIRLGLHYLVCLLASVFFGLHPMHVESVAWVTERKDILYGIFYLSSCLLYIRYLLNNSKKAYIISLSFGLLSILSKPMAVSLPWILFIFDFWFKRPVSWKMIIDKIPFAIIIIPFALQTFLKLGPKPPFIWPNSLLILSWSLAFYIWKFFIPYPLLPVYVAHEPVHLFHWPYFLSIIFWIFIIISLWRWRHSRLFIFAFFWFFGSIFFFGRVAFNDINIVADRFMYLPSLGICALLAFLLHHLIIQRKHFGITLSIILIGFLGFMTFIQSSHWKDDHSLWQWTINQSPKNSMARTKINALLFANNQPVLTITELEQLKNISQDSNKYYTRGVIALKAGYLPMALRDFDLAIKHDPQLIQAYINRGSIWEFIDSDNQALKDFNQAILLNPHYSLGYLNRGIIYTKDGHFSLAMQDYNKAINLEPTRAEAYFRRGLLWSYQRAFEKSIKDITMAIQLLPKNANYYYERAIIYKHLNIFDKAILDLQKAIHLNPAYIEAYNQLGAIYVHLQLWQKALDSFNTVIQLDPYNHILYKNRSNIFLNLEQYDLALADLDKAILLNNTPWQAIITKGDVLMVLGDPKEAIKTFKKAIAYAPEKEINYFKLARAFYDDKQFQAALKMINHYIKLKPNDPDGYSARSLIWEKLNKLKLSKEDKNKAQALSGLPLD